MLKLKDIKKDYKVADTVVHALKGINVEFRKNEFVSILGPSGCGKTTLLNIIGGLDHYTSGDLFINGKSTKEYKDRDWDVYRNHRIGFIFQSYNLIPHQTILGNVELALTIAGVSKEERIRRAKEALDRVGLSDQYYKHPNQLSGGQCQRVAIARALVNEPEILLADEPTGALDTKTSVQIMEILKEIAKEKLIIMVTHNPELAEKYSNRIIRLLDGNVVEDSNPYIEEENEKKEEVMVNEKAKMSLWTAFKLSARNLKSKLKRTLMVCLAASIGIIGVSAVLAVSTGVKTFISDMQDDMLSGNPITISETSVDLESLMGMMSESSKEEAIKQSIEDGYVNVNSLVEYLVKQGETMEGLQISNDIREEYIAYLEAMPKDYYIAMNKDYGIDLNNNIYTTMDFSGSEERLTSISAITKVYTSLLEETEFKDYAGMVESVSSSFAQSLDNEEYILSQYDIVSDKAISKVATEYNEIMIVLNDNQELNDILLAQLGYYTQEEFLNLVYKATSSEEYNANLDKTRFSYDELMNKTFVWYPNNEVYNTIDPSNPLYQVSPFTYNPYVNENFENGIELKVTAILKPKENLNYGSLSSGFYYTPALTEKIIENSIDSDIVNYLENDTENDSFTSMEYNGMSIGITYSYDYQVDDNSEVKSAIGYVGSKDAMASIMGSFMENIPDTYTLSLRQLGGNELPSTISIYPLDFDRKYLVTDYLDAWNNSEDIVINGTTLKDEDRNEIKYTDAIALVINIMNSMIDIITVALVAFTSLSLVVSTVMIAIIIYVSVIERIKEIGVIRSLGGRKKDVSHLFNAEAVIIGASSGLIGVGITYLLSFIVNMIVSSSGIVDKIAILPISYAAIIVLISTLLTSISGLIPAKMAAKKDPVVALRSE